MFNRVNSVLSATRFAKRTIKRNYTRSTKLFSKTFSSSKPMKLLFKKRRVTNNPFHGFGSPHTKMFFHNIDLPKSNQQPESFECSIPKEDLNSFGGQIEARIILSDIVRYFQNPNSFTDTGAKAPNGIILTGPPGVGKTFLAKATAGHAAVPLILVSGAEFGSRYVGESEKKLRSLFKLAEQKAPCVVCIDELDSIGTKRFSSGVNSHYANSMVNQLLTLLSQERPDVVVMATTNHYDKLDPALIRPGRFDRNIPISLPERKEREQILDIHMKNKKLTPQLSIKKLASLSGGFTGAKIESWVNEAAILCARNNKREIEEDHFEEARTILDIGVPRKSSSNFEKKIYTAVHEAGHALVGHLLNFKVHKITIREHGKAAGFVEFIPDDDVNQTKGRLLDAICKSLAGRAAELVYGEACVGASSDLKRARYLIDVMIKHEAMGSSFSSLSKEKKRILKQQLERAKNLISSHRKQWVSLIETLVEHDELLRDDFVNIFQDIPLTKERSLWLKKRTETSKFSLPPKSKKPLKKSSEVKNKLMLQSNNNQFSKLNNSRRENSFIPLKQIANALQVPVKFLKKIEKTDRNSILIRCQIISMSSLGLIQISELLNKHKIVHKIEHTRALVLIPYSQVSKFIQLVKSCK